MKTDIEQMLELARAGSPREPPNGSRLGRMYVLNRAPRPPQAPPAPPPDYSDRPGMRSLRTPNPYIEAATRGLDEANRASYGDLWGQYGVPAGTARKVASYVLGDTATAVRKLNRGEGLRGPQQGEPLTYLFNDFTNPALEAAPLAGLVGRAARTTRLTKRPLPISAMAGALWLGREGGVEAGQDYADTRGY